MPLTEIQANILRQIAQNRNPGSYLAGATVLHRHPSSPRTSQDLDLFHDLQECVAQCAEMDAATLRTCEYGFEWILRTPSFHRAIVTAHGQHVKIEWAQDSAFRFFPVQQDPLCGYRLHDIDAAINKVLALAGRSEVRDYVDVLHLHATTLPMGAMVWAACGKDPGYTPGFLLDQCSRHTAYGTIDLQRLDLRHPLDPGELKNQWLQAAEQARQLVDRLPPDELGCLYLDGRGQPIAPDMDSESFPSLARHRGSVGGAWPTLSMG
jgi:hypothetical protein